MRSALAAIPAIAFVMLPIVVGFATTMAVPAFLPGGVALVAAGALLGTIRVAGQRDWQSLIRHALLAVSAFGYPVFLGGHVLPWAAFLAHVALLVIGWRAGVTERARVALLQALAAGFALSTSIAATQFFFPAAWRWVALVAVALYLALLCATIPEGVLHRMPVPAVSAVVLALSEGLVILHYLPTHWAVNGAVLALAFAAFLERERLPRALFASLLVVVLLFGSFS